MQEKDNTQSLINFCVFSFDSVNPRVVFTAAVVLFNTILCYKGNKSTLLPQIQNAVEKIVETISREELVDVEALMGLLLCECRLVYQNRDICQYVLETYDKKFKESHLKLKARISDAKVKECVNDVLKMIYID